MSMWTNRIAEPPNDFVSNLMPRPLSNAAPAAPLAAGPIAVWLVCRVQLYKDAIAELLSQQQDIDLIGVEPSDLEILALIDGPVSGLVLLDMTTPGAFALAKRLMAERPSARILGFGVDIVALDVISCAEAGLRGFVPRTASIADLVTAVKRVAMGETVCSAGVADGLFQDLRDVGAARKDVLTSRQIEIAGLLGRGLSNKDIARHLSLGPSTVKNHVHEILARLEVTTRAEAGRRVNGLPERV